MRRLALSLALLCACSPAPSGMDASQPPDDAGIDAGKPDAGKPDAGKPDAGQPDAGFVNVTVGDWCRDLLLANCEREVRCLSLSPGGVPECLAMAADTCDQAAYSRGVSEGRLQFLSAKAADCLNAFASGSCSEKPAACDVVFAGKQPPDGGCVLAEECNPAGYCYQYDSACPHKCLPYLSLGDPCDGFTTRCKPEEGACGLNDAGLQRCIPLRNEGESCPQYDSCRADLACANGICLKRYAGPGEVCAKSSGFPYCATDYYCRQDITVMVPDAGVCEPRGGLGAVCAGYGSCLPTLRCGSAFSTSTCMARIPVGGVCSAYGECEDGLFCSPRSSRCEALPGDGGDCTSQGSYFECRSAHFCDFDSPNGLYTCRPRRLQGETCNYDQVCLSNDCNYGMLPDGGFGGRCDLPCSQKADGGF